MKTTLLLISAKLCVCIHILGSECFYVKPPDDPVVTRTISFLNIRDDTNYQIHETSALFEEDFREEVGKLPQLLQTLYEYRVLRVIFIEDFITSGQVLRMRTHDNSEGYIILLNADVLTLTMNEWYDLQLMKILNIRSSTGNAKLKRNDSIPGYLYIFIHEMFHILDYWAHHDPSLREVQEHLGMIGNDQWSLFGELKDDFQLSHKIQYILPTEMDLEDAVDLFKELGSLPLLSLTSFLGRGEDFAEFMTFYCLEYHLGVHLELEFFNSSKELVYTYSPFDNSESWEDRKRVANFLFTQLLNQEG